MAASVALTAAAEGEARERMRDLRDRAVALRGEAVGLAGLDTESYRRVLEAGGPDEAGAALSQAADPPLAIAELAAELAELAAEAARSGNPRLRGDAFTAALLAEAACRAASELVTIDLADIPRDPRHERSRRASARGWSARERARSGA